MFKALVIVGPTAVGKSALAEKYAKNYQLPLINADSRQIYKELNIGVAKPSETDLKSVQYYEIDSCSIKEDNNVGLYITRVKKLLQDLNSDVIIVGGTGLYVKALIEGIDVLPPKNELLRKELKEVFMTNGITALQQIYSSIKNPYPIKDVQNPNRLIRAIEMGEKQQTTQIEPPLKNHEVHVLGLEMERRLLYHNINLRVDGMIHAGLLAEVKNLYPYKHLPSLQTVGYQELFSFIEEKVTYDAAIDKIKQHTRNYAKRQMTYFRNQLNVNWFSTDDNEKINTFVSNIL